MANVKRLQTIIEEPAAPELGHEESGESDEDLDEIDLAEEQEINGIGNGIDDLDVLV